MSAVIVFVDTETLGLDPDEHAVWEVGAVRYDTESGARQERLWQIRLTEQQVEHGDPIGMEIGRFAERYNARDGYEPWDFCEEFGEFTEGSHLAGNVVSFDEERLRRLCREHGVKPGWHYHLIDVENLAVGHLRGYLRHVVALPWKSDELCQLLGIDPDAYDRHTALGDARWALDTYLAVMGGAR